MTTVKSPTYARSPPPQRLNIDRCIKKSKSLRVQQARADIFHSNREIQRNFRLRKTHLFHNSVHRRALVLLPCLRKCLRCENSARESRNSHYFWSCNVTTYKREPTTRAWNIWRQDGAIFYKNRKIVPYLGSARIPRLTVSVPDYGSWFWSYPPLGSVCRLYFVF